MANELTRIPKFRRCVLQNFPFIEQDFDALTDYELLCKVVEYLNKVIANEKALAESQTNLIVQFNTLKDYVDNYFANLDIQEEINNKLDQMAEDGTLQEIITAYIQANVTWTFDTVADMKDATNLVAGSYARTLGFHTINDEGGATYYITDSGTANEMDVIAIGSLYANLVTPSQLNIKQLGATTASEITDHYSRALTISKNILIKDIDGTIETWPAITVGSNTNIKLVNSKLYTKANVTAGSSQSYRTGLIYIKDASNVNIIGDNAELIGDMDSHSSTQHQWNCGVRVYNSKNINIVGIKAEKHTGDGIAISAASSYVTVEKCEITNNFRNGISVIDAFHTIIESNNLHDNGFNIAPYCGIDVEPDPVENEFVDDLVIRNNVFKGNYYTIELHDPYWNDDTVLTSKIKNVSIINNYFDNTSRPSANSARFLVVQGLKDGHLIVRDNYIANYRVWGLIQKSKHVDFINNEFKTAGYYGFDISDSEYLNFDSNKFYDCADRVIYAKRINYCNFTDNDFFAIKHFAFYITTENDSSQVSKYNLIKGNKIYSFAGSSAITGLIGLYFYSQNNIVDSNIITFTNSNLSYCLVNTASQSSNNIFSNNILKAQTTGAMQTGSGVGTLMNVVDNVLDKGSLFTE